MGGIVPEWWEGGSEPESSGSDIRPPDPPESILPATERGFVPVPDAPLPMSPLPGEMRGFVPVPDPGPSYYFSPQQLQEFAQNQAQVVMDEDGNGLLLDTEGRSVKANQQDIESLLAQGYEPEPVDDIVVRMRREEMASKTSEAGAFARSAFNTFTAGIPAKVRTEENEWAAQNPDHPLAAMLREKNQPLLEKLKADEEVQQKAKALGTIAGAVGGLLSPAGPMAAAGRLGRGAEKAIRGQATSEAAGRIIGSGVRAATEAGAVGLGEGYAAMELGATPEQAAEAAINSALLGGGLGAGFSVLGRVGGATSKYIQRQRAKMRQRYVDKAVENATGKLREEVQYITDRIGDELTPRVRARIVEANGKLKAADAKETEAFEHVLGRLRERQARYKEVPGREPTRFEAVDSIEVAERFGDKADKIVQKAEALERLANRTLSKRNLNTAQREEARRSLAKAQKMRDEADVLYSKDIPAQRAMEIDRPDQAHFHRLAQAKNLTPGETRFVLSQWDQAKLLRKQAKEIFADINAGKKGVKVQDLEQHLDDLTQQLKAKTREITDKQIAELVKKQSVFSDTAGKPLDSSGARGRLFAASIGSSVVSRTLTPLLMALGSPRRTIMNKLAPLFDRAGQTAGVASKAGAGVAQAVNSSNWRRGAQAALVAESMSPDEALQIAQEVHSTPVAQVRSEAIDEAEHAMKTWAVDPAAAMHGAIVPVKASEFLKSKLPPTFMRTVNDYSLPDPYMTGEERSMWSQYVRAAQIPQTLLEDLSKGQLTHPTVETWQAVYPEALEELRGIVRAAVKAYRGKVPRSTMQQVKILLGEDVTNPELIRMVQQGYADAKQSEQRQGQVGDVADSTRTQLEGAMRNLGGK